MKEESDPKTQKLIREIFELLGFRGAKAEEALGKLLGVVQTSVLQGLILDLSDKKQKAVAERVEKSISEAGKEEAVLEALKENYTAKQIQARFGKELGETVSDYIRSSMTRLSADRQNQIEGKLKEIAKI